MPMKYSLGTNANGVHETVHDEGSRLVIARKQIVDPILKENAIRRHMANKSAHGRLTSQIPVTLYYQWKKEWQQKWSDKVTWNSFRNMKLNSRDFQKLRCDDGRKM